MDKDYITYLLDEVYDFVKKDDTAAAMSLLAAFDYGREHERRQQSLDKQQSPAKGHD